MSYFPLTPAAVVAAIAGEDIAPANIDPTAGADITLASGSQIVLPSSETTIITTDVDSGIRLAAKEFDYRTDNGSRFRITAVRIHAEQGLVAEASTQAITGVGNTITGFKWLHRVTPDAVYTLTSNPCIAASVDGQVLILQNDGVDTLTLPNGNGVEFDGGVDLALATNSLIFLIFHSADATWYQATPESVPG